MQSELKIIATVVVPYSLIMPAIYLYFYWKSFDIQPFEFISVTDSISYAFKPFILILLNLVPLCLSIGINAKEARSRPANEKGFLPKGISLPVIVIFNAAIFLLAEIGGEIDYWFFGCGVAMVVMCSLIMSYEAGFKESIKSNATRVTLFLAISLSPCVTVFFAVLESKNVLSNCTASYILPSDIKGSKSQSQEKLIYLGKLSDNLIFFEKNQVEFPLIPYLTLIIFQERNNVTKQSTGWFLSSSFAIPLRCILRQKCYLKPTGYRNVRFIA